jgi:hypothetical protein
MPLALSSAKIQGSPFHPYDDRITSLSLHHQLNTAIGHDVIITALRMNL